MSADHIETFRSSLRGSATLHETEAEDATDTLAAVVESPAVGTPLPFEGVSLPEPIETEFSPSDLEAAQTGVTPARHAIASYGTVTLPSDAAGTELASLYAPRHVAVVAASTLLPDMAAAYEHLDADISGEGDIAGEGNIASEGDIAAGEGNIAGEGDIAADANIAGEGNIASEGGSGGREDASRETQVLATGPSATADMGTLVEGVHGPHEVHIVLLEDR